jgi:hypothetical protein
VTNLNDAGPGSLRQAILDTPADGTVDFQPGLTGTIILTTGELELHQSVTVQGAGADALAVSGNDASRVFEVFGGATVVLADLSVTHGQVSAAGARSVSALGGGICVDADATLTARGVVLSNNLVQATAAEGMSGMATGEGGAIFCAGALIAIGCTLTGNSAMASVDISHGGIANGAGGGIYNGSGTLALSGCTVSGNTAMTGPASGAANGGGIYSDGPLTVTNSLVSANTAVSGSRGCRGGGIYSGGPLSPTFGPLTMTLSASTISGNRAVGKFQSGAFGAGVYGGGTITACTISGNFLDAFVAYGGGFYGGGAIIDCTISRNTAIDGLNFGEGGGGGVGGFIQLTVTGCTISGNSTSGLTNRGGGGIYGGTLKNTIVAGNRAPSSSDVVAILSQGHNLIGDGSGATGFDPTDLVGTSANPIDPMLGPFQDNGGPTQTMALLIGSPAIAAGDPTGAPDFDQRGPGFPRVVNGTIDIGAFEVQPAPSVASVQINDGSAQRSMVTSLTVTFNGVVTLEPGALQLEGPGGLVPLNVVTSVVGNQTLAVITFSGPDIIGGSQPDGDYTLTVMADRLHDPSRQTLTADSVTSFFRLFGDSNGNGIIDFQDLERFASTFGKGEADTNYLAYFDYYGDGRVDFDDLIQLLRRIGKHV